MDELGVKLNSPVSSWNLDSGKSNVPGYTTETHSPLLAGTASSILNSSSVCVSVRTWFCGVGHLELVRWIMTSYFTMTSFKLLNHEFQIVSLPVYWNIYLLCQSRIVFLLITLFYQCLSKTTKMSLWRSTGKRQKCRFGAERIKWPDWNVTILFRFFPKMFEMTTEKVFHADDKYVFRLLNVVVHRENTTNSTSTRRRTRSQTTSGSLCSKLEVFIWRHVVYVPKLSTTFRGILICVILAPGICKNTICYSGSSQRMWVYISCLFSILP
jgi:hypothetical protein